MVERAMIKAILGGRRAGSRLPGRRMTTTGTDLGANGISPVGEVFANLSIPGLYEHALKQPDVYIADGGPLVVETGSFTGRSPKDKFVVEEPGSKDRIWWGNINQPISEDNAGGLKSKLQAHLSAQPQLFVVDAYAGADPEQRNGDSRAKYYGDRQTLQTELNGSA